MGKQIANPQSLGLSPLSQISKILGVPVRTLKIRTFYDHPQIANLQISKKYVCEKACICGLRKFQVRQSQKRLGSQITNSQSATYAEGLQIKLFKSANLWICDLRSFFADRLPFGNNRCNTLYNWTSCTDYVMSTVIIHTVSSNLSFLHINASEH